MLDVIPTSPLARVPAKREVCPLPALPITTRLATMADLPFLDALQKKYHKQLGFFPRAQLEGYVAGGHVLVAEENGRVGVGLGVGPETNSDPTHTRTPTHTHSPLGYCISKDRYLKRDELGVIYQLCVAPGHQRGLIGATLIKAVFERSAYGCRLYCCWCAQDLAANYFWESLGFSPLAFRAGSDKKKRVHIFWQRRIDSVTPSPNRSVTSTPYWYPFQTNGGAIRADRIVFPIPPGVHWSEVRAPAVRAVQVPVGDRGSGVGVRGSGEERKRLPSPTRNPKPEPRNPNKVGILVGGRIKYVDRPGYVAPVVEKAGKGAKSKAPKAPAERIDPKYLTAARELRDRYLERVNSEPYALPAAGKYDVTRALGAPAAQGAVPLLTAA